MKSVGAFKPFAVLAVAALLLLSQATSAAAAQVFNVTEPATTIFPNGFVNPCNGETIRVTEGVGHLHLETTTSANGGFHADINGNLEGVKGTGSLGNSYTVTAWFHESTNSSSNSAFVFSDGDVFHLLSSGSAPNFDFSAVIHVTINPNGDVTATVSDIRPKCVG
jgi:hypothetical protein